MWNAPENPIDTFFKSRAGTKPLSIAFSTFLWDVGRMWTYDQWPVIIHLEIIKTTSRALVMHFTFLEVDSCRRLLVDVKTRM